MIDARKRADVTLLTSRLSVVYGVPVRTSGVLGGDLRVIRSVDGLAAFEATDSGFPSWDCPGVCKVLTTPLPAPSRYCRVERPGDEPGAVILVRFALFDCL
jgi:hypothetical protein